MPSATLAANGGIGNLLLGTTYSTNGIILDNTSADGARIARVDLRMLPTLLPKLVFDPKTDTDGLAAGDSLNKDFTRDPGSVGTFAVTPTLTEAFSGGYRTLTLDFTGFDPGDRLAFSIDQDPISIKGGGREDASNAGAIVGVELVGMAVTVDRERLGEHHECEQGDQGGRVVSAVGGRSGSFPQRVGHGSVAAGSREGHSCVAALGRRRGMGGVALGSGLRVGAA